ncbi:hypothetical protein PILCRDRAFT_562213 [Piloderma croceum F 1598]|uniref:Uncharacterized protein n=1 Tax=Piloderma croceum (strain F 1598) TaxID=765440 RepID=A0A0C3BPQ1_PILCF|nr:hypothetical protein PILCRDRAFT_562213 [Piloderma croceum F 1598]
MKASVIDGRKCKRVFVVVDGVGIRRFHIGCKDAVDTTTWRVTLNKLRERAVVWPSSLRRLRWHRHRSVPQNGPITDGSDDKTHTPKTKFWFGFWSRFQSISSTVFYPTGPTDLDGCQNPDHSDFECSMYIMPCYILHAWLHGSIGH